jgi:hypothetical protein
MQPTNEDCLGLMAELARLASAAGRWQEEPKAARITILMQDATAVIHHPAGLPETLRRITATDQLFVLLGRPDETHHADQVEAMATRGQAEQSRSVDTNPAAAGCSQSAQRGERVATRRNCSEIRRQLQELRTDLETAKLDPHASPQEVEEIKAKITALTKALGLTINHRGHLKQLDQSGHQAQQRVRKNIDNAISRLKRDAPRLFAVIHDRIDLRVGRLAYTPRQGDPPIDIVY